MRRILRNGLAATALAAAIAASAATQAWASFTSSGTASMSVSSAHIFPTTATVTGYDVGDASAGGSEVATPDPAAFTDGTTYTSSSSFQTSFSTTRYLDFTLSGPLASGVAVSSPAFDFDFHASAAARTVCFYFEVYNATTSALLETHGSGTTPVGCVTGTTNMTTATPLTAVTTSNLADALRVRVYLRSVAAGTAVVDRAVVAGSTAYQSFTHEPDLLGDCSASCGTAVSTPARLVAQDTAGVTSAASWPTAFSTTRYIRIGFPPTVPSAADVSSATLTLALRAATAGRNLCVYVAVYSSTTLLATHGSSGTPAICTSTGSNVVLTLPLPEITTATQANSAQIRVYADSNASGKSIFDQASLAVAYSLD
ncbi:MAG: hypothetical protein ACTHNU_08000 [Gaiellales bacterium]